MNSYHHQSYQYPNLLVTVKHETDERSVSETNNSKSRAYRSKKNSKSSYLYPTIIYYNSNYLYQQQKQGSSRRSSLSNSQRRMKKNDQFYYNNQQQQQPIRPLMEIIDNNNYSYNDFNSQKRNSSKRNPREPTQRGQYRNRKAELDWDHAFDLDQADLYTIQHDSDNQSLTSLYSFGESSLSSV